MKPNSTEYKLKELTKLYPEIVSMVNRWQMLAKVHGDQQSDEEKKIIKRYVEILKSLGVINHE